MKGDMPTAALRLLCAFPVRTHEHKMIARQGEKASHVRAIIVGGTLYESMTEASRQIGIGREALRKRIYKGTARYA